MVAALFAALRGSTPLYYLVAGVPVAFLVASAWARFQLSTTVAEIYVRHDQAATKTIWECVRGRKSPVWHPVLDLRTTGDAVSVTIGDAQYTLPDKQWENPRGLLNALYGAVQFASQPVPAQGDSHDNH